VTDVIETIRDYWDRHAERDPLWAVLSDTAKRDGKWDVAQFFRTGISEIETVLYTIHAQQFALCRGSAMDFGCGVGRLTQALGSHFDRVVGVDVSPRMLELAERLNERPGTVSYVNNQAADLHLRCPLVRLHRQQHRAAARRPRCRVIVRPRVFSRARRGRHRGIPAAFATSTTGQPSR
jgi:SAM-dependent methyltransferase